MASGCLYYEFTLSLGSEVGIGTSPRGKVNIVFRFRPGMEDGMGSTGETRREREGG